jgi:hypothetical protein
MGSFANSVHVKSSDADRVAATIREFFDRAGWEPTDKAPDWNDRFGNSNLRALQISAPRDGWVSILDTDLVAAPELGAALAQSLATHAIFFFVNDSDAWSYALAGPSGELSEFESHPEDDDEDFDEASLEQLQELTKQASRLRELMSEPAHLQRIQQFNDQMLAQAPPEIREIHARMQRGQVTSAEIQQYQAWSMQEMPKYKAQFQALLGLDDFTPQPRPKKKSKPKRKQTKTQQRAQRERLLHLRPLLAPGVTDEQVQDVLDQGAVFAEDVLAEFMPLLGIAEIYSTLSYRYLNEMGKPELASHNIHFVHHLQYETNAPPQILRFSTDVDL